MRSPNYRLQRTASGPSPLAVVSQDLRWTLAGAEPGR